MTLLKKIYVPLLGIVICLILPWIIDFGSLINKFYPCIEDPTRSVSCTIDYFINAVLVLLFIAAILLGVVIFRIVKLFRVHRKGDTGLRGW